MGAIAQFRSGLTTLPMGDKAHGVAQEAVQSGRRLWRQAFNFGTDKESALRNFPRVRDRQSWTRGVIAEPAAFKRLLQAMRSMAPGGWSDDRWEQSKHENGIVYAAIHRKAEQMGVAEFQVFKRDHEDPDGKRPVTPKDPPEGGRPLPPYALVELLQNPNNDDSFGELMYGWSQQMDLTGLSLTWMVPNKLGIPYELYNIPTAIAIPQPAINPDYPDGYYRIQPIYPYGPFSSYPTPATAVGAPIPAQWMLRFKIPHPLLRYDGYSPLTALKLHIDEVEAMDRSRWYTMQRIINPSGILNFRDVPGMEPFQEAEVERIRSDFEANFQGPENSGRLFVAAPGSELTIQEARLRDLEFRDGWNQLVEFILGAGFGISKTASGMVESSTYSVLFATLKQLHMVTLDPMCRRIARYLTKHLAPFFGDDLIVEIKTPRIDDHDIQNSVLQLLVNARAITKNEMRKELKFPLSLQGWGDEVAGTESQQGMMPGAPGMPGMGAPGTPGADMGGVGAAGPLAGASGGTPGGGMPPAPPAQPGAPATQALAGPGLKRPPLAERIMTPTKMTPPKIGPSERQAVQPEPPSVRRSRPRPTTSSGPIPSTLNRHSQGPRKSLISKLDKILNRNGATLNGHRHE